MAKKVNDSMILEEEDKKFIEDKKKIIAVSGAQIILDKEEIKELSEEINKTNKRLRLLL